MSPPAEPDLEVHGDFRLPGANDKKVPGSLTFSAKVGGSLQMIGSFTEGHLLVEESRTKDYSRILGQDDKSAFTPDGCLRTRETWNWCVLALLRRPGRQRRVVRSV